MWLAKLCWLPAVSHAVSVTVAALVVRFAATVAAATTTAITIAAIFVAATASLFGLVCFTIGHMVR